MARRIMRLRRREPVAAGTVAHTLVFGREPFTFLPGQAMDVFIKTPGGAELQHPFTIAGSGGADAIQFATRMRDTEFKNTLRDLPDGAEIEVDGPWGEFTLPTMAYDVVCLAGGIGVTPFRAMAQWIVAGSLPIDFAVLHSNRTPEETPFFAELKRWSSSYPRFNYAPTMTQMEKSKEPFIGHRGRIDAAFLDALLDDRRADALYMVAGPEGFVRAVVAALAEVGIPDLQVMSEEFPGYAR